MWTDVRLLARSHSTLLVGGTAEVIYVCTVKGVPVGMSCMCECLLEWTDLNRFSFFVGGDDGSSLVCEEEFAVE